MNKTHLIILYLAMLVLSLATSLTYDLTIADSRQEIGCVKGIIINGWNFRTNNALSNTSVAIGLITPAISKAIDRNPQFIYRVIYPFIFSFTPVLLYLLYLKFLTTSQAFLATLFFITLPPTYKSIPTTAKGMWAEPLAVATLLLYFSNARTKYKMPILAILIFLTAIMHYTVGFLLIGVLIVTCIVGSNIKKEPAPLLIPIGTATLATLGYYMFAGDGIVIRSISQWGNCPLRISDYVLDIIVCKNGVSANLASGIFYIVHFSLIGIAIVGAIYFIKYRDNAFRNLEFSIGIVTCSIIMGIVTILPILRIMLFYDRWTQYSSVFLSPLIAWSANWIPQRLVYLLVFIYFIFSCGFIAYLFPGIPFLPVSSWWNN